MDLEQHNCQLFVTHGHGDIGRTECPRRATRRRAAHPRRRLTFAAMLIVADDLTGAADAAGAFARWGHDCRVNLRVDTGGSASVLAIDTDSRAMSASDAAGVTAEAVRRHPGRQLMIKIDSTMRGHVRATVDAAASAMHRMPRRVIVCPAFPAFGRTVVDGVVYSGGEPLATGQLRKVFSGTVGK